ncbi:MAG TPA: nickel-dependent lactate racemase [Alphaproteobacteria bacterium]|jgi:nickel-dependent lactate racemase|nr:nickel-dependent lactate racemase [Alphaproteobacteria bacterium]
MIVDLAFGKSTLAVELPTDCQATVLRKRPLPMLQDAAAALDQTLDRPLGAAPFDTLASGCKSACILICDITRPVPNGLFLGPMIRRLLAQGLAAEDIKVLVATGLHRPNEGAELAELVGDPWILETVEVANHFARNDADHVDLGRTAKRGTPIRLDRRFVEADLRIATGLVEPHFMAGYSGGRKVVAPGIAHEETIRTFHSARFMEDPAAIQCNLEGNPLHEEQLEIMSLLAPVYALNTVLDEERNLVHVNFGEIVESHLAAVEFVRGATEVAVERRFATVVTSAAGYPLDKTYYQTVKGMVTPLDILEPGGTLIIASECSEGFGSAEFAAAQKRLVELGPEAFLETLLAKTLADVDEWQTEMQLKPMRQGEIKFFTRGLSPDELAITGVETIPSVEAAVAEAVARSGDPAVAVIPEGPYVVPFYRAGAAN